MPTAVKLVRWP